jgi:hypothetical protein
MPPEFAQPFQQLFARQMTLALLEHCVRLDALGDGPEAQALEAEFLLEPQP